MLFNVTVSIAGWEAQEIAERLSIYRDRGWSRLRFDRLGDWAPIALLSAPRPADAVAADWRISPWISTDRKPVLARPGDD